MDTNQIISSGIALLIVTVFVIIGVGMTENTSYDNVFSVDTATHFTFSGEYDNTETSGDNLVLASDNTSGEYLLQNSQSLMNIDNLNQWEKASFYDFDDELFAPRTGSDSDKGDYIFGAEDTEETYYTSDDLNEEQGQATYVTMEYEIPDADDGDTIAFSSTVDDNETVIDTDESGSDEVASTEFKLPDEIRDDAGYFNITMNRDNASTGDSPRVYSVYLYEDNESLPTTGEVTRYSIDTEIDENSSVSLDMAGETFDLSDGDNTVDVESGEDTVFQLERDSSDDSSPEVQSIEAEEQKDGFVYTLAPFLWVILLILALAGVATRMTRQL